MKIREKMPEKFPKILFPAHGLGGEFKGFTIEDGTPEQITNLVFHYMPEMKVKVVPIFESKKTTELYLKMKKRLLLEAALEIIRITIWIKPFLLL